MLRAGTRLGPYEIHSVLGAGGMGEVYRARDTKLGRDVALKILPEIFANDPERLARLEREARLLAALNHPHIAAIYGFEDADGVHALVLELVEGSSLADRVAAGPIPVNEALSLARQMADALDAAHEKKIFHRDLKPANINVTHDGILKVLDFGLAKAWTGDAAGVDLSQAPTVTATEEREGAWMGTPAYMSPEQARGKSLDKRTDIWAFGCVLYEMLTGRMAFGGETLSDTIARILEHEPDWGALPTRTPLKVRDLVRRCLQKDANRRLRDIGDARIELEEAQTAATGETVALPAPRPVAVRRRAAFAAGVALLAGGIVVGLSVWVAMRLAPPRVTRFTITPPATAPLTLEGTGRDLAIAPDGTRIVYVGANGTALVVQALDQLIPTVLTGLGAPSHPVFSPDGQWIAFFDGATALKKVPTTGGPAVTLSVIKGPPNGGANWTADDTIIFVNGDQGTGLLRVRAAGGEPEVLSRPDRSQGEMWHYHPEVLPGGRAVLFTILPSGTGENQVAVLDLRTGWRKVLVRGGSQAQYVPPGYLVYQMGGTLWAVAFDLGRLAILGSPVPVVEGVVTAGARTGADFSVAADGTMVYVPAAAQTGSHRMLVWVDRQGREQALAAPPRAYVYPRLSPNGTRVAVAVADQENDVWIWDLSRETPLRRFTFDAGFDLYPVWTPDGRRLLWGVGGARGAPPNLYSQAADGSGAAERLTDGPNTQYISYPLAISPDGTRLVVREDRPGTGLDLALLTLNGEWRITPLIRTASSEGNGEISPDGRWLAYESDESGRKEIYVRPFPVWWTRAAGRSRFRVGSSRSGPGTAGSSSTAGRMARWWRCASKTPTRVNVARALTGARQSRSCTVSITSIAQVCWAAPTMCPWMVSAF